MSEGLPGAKETVPMSRLKRMLLPLLALIGAIALVAAATLVALPDWRVVVAEALFETLDDAAGDDEAAEPVSAHHKPLLSRLKADEAAVAQWLARKYRVGAEPVAALVVEARELARTRRIPANLMLALAAIESNFSPFAQSEAGAQGLMQVMRGVHAPRFRKYGGDRLIFDPVVNFKVGIEILGDCIRLRGGSIEAGLGCYLGGSTQDEVDRYVGKVMAEKQAMDAVAEAALARDRAAAVPARPSSPGAPAPSAASGAATQPTVAAPASVNAH
jgi:hypothetical protein